MKKFKVNSYQLVESSKWVPCGTIFEIINGREMNIQEVEFPSEYKFDTKEDADKYFVDYYQKIGCFENFVQ